jgi:hypothetical protein
MNDRVTSSWRRRSDGLREWTEFGIILNAERLPSHAREERQLDAWEDDGGMVATSPKPIATPGLPVPLQMTLP